MYRNLVIWVQDSHLPPRTCRFHYIKSAFSDIPRGVILNHLDPSPFRLGTTAQPKLELDPFLLRCAENSSLHSTGVHNHMRECVTHREFLNNMSNIVISLEEDNICQKLLGKESPAFLLRVSIRFTACEKLWAFHKHLTDRNHLLTNGVNTEENFVLKAPELHLQKWEWYNFHCFVPPHPKSKLGGKKKGIVRRLLTALLAVPCSAFTERIR